MDHGAFSVHRGSGVGAGGHLFRKAGRVGSDSRNRHQVDVRMCKFLDSKQILAKNHFFGMEIAIGKFPLLQPVSRPDVQCVRHAGLGGCMHDQSFFPGRKQ
jgi:hypothetical protein